MRVPARPQRPRVRGPQHAHLLGRARRSRNGSCSAIAAAGVDAVIVQDLGLVRLVKRVAPDAAGPRLHADDADRAPRHRLRAKSSASSAWCWRGNCRWTTSARSTAQTDVPVEVFVHGALCVAYSGQCLTSEALGGRSANRGQCAQACRLPYEMIVDGTPRDLGDRAYLLSPQDLAAYDLIDPLDRSRGDLASRSRAGSRAARTSRRPRRPTARPSTPPPRSAGFHLPRREELDLAQTFSRGLTPGFLEGVNHQKLVRGRFPKSRGVRIGTGGRDRRGAASGSQLCGSGRGLGEAGRRRDVRLGHAAGERAGRPGVGAARSERPGTPSLMSRARWSCSSSGSGIDLSRHPGRLRRVEDRRPRLAEAA